VLTGIRPEQVAQALRRPSEPEPKPGWFNLKNGLKVLAFGTRLGFQVGSIYYHHQCYWSSRQQLVLGAAQRQHGWLSQADVLKALEYRHSELDRVISNLCAKNLCRRVPGRAGQPVFLFDAFLPPIHFCDYCDQERPQGPRQACPYCGAP
jgi:hypothetical protein